MTDKDGKDASQALKGSNEGSFTDGPAPNSVIKIEDTQPGSNTLMELSEFFVTNGKSVQVTVYSTNGDVFSTTVRQIGSFIFKNYNSVFSQQSASLGGHFF